MIETTAWDPAERLTSKEAITERWDSPHEPIVSRQNGYGFKGAGGDIITAMTKLLEEAVAKVRDLPDGDQDALAVAMLSIAETEAPVMAMDEQTRAAIREGMEQARRGEFVPDVEIEALWKQHDS